MMVIKNASQKFLQIQRNKQMSKLKQWFLMYDDYIYDIEWNYKQAKEIVIIAHTYNEARAKFHQYKPNNTIISHSWRLL
jgi:surface antigen